ncbi:GTPase, G3E family [Rhizobiales bacterium GAS113]|nr:GTPase, G3E family [Rhizobiales bacterium GAS113]
MQPPAPIPLDILTGFLGAGKTTLLNALVKEDRLAGAVVLINEFGEIGLDHLLVQGVEGDMIMLSSGCLCCTIRGELVSALEDLLRRRDNQRIRAFDRVVIETTGLADPAPILNTLIAHPYLSRRFLIDSVVTVVDAVNGAATLDAHEEARRQVAVADRLVLTKGDLADETAIPALAARLRRLNPTAPLLDPASGEAGCAALFDAGLYAPHDKIPDVARWLNDEALAQHSEDAAAGAHAHADGHAGHLHQHRHDLHHHDVNRHDERIRAFTLTSRQPVEAAAIDLFLQLLRSIEPGKLLRLKGLVALAERPEEPMVVHGVQHVVHEPVRLARWPSADRSTRLVLIVEDLPEDQIRKLWAALSNVPAPDRPDRQALRDNPLKITTGGLLG